MQLFFVAAMVVVEMTMVAFNCGCMALYCVPTNMQLCWCSSVCVHNHSTSLVSIVITCDKLLLLTPTNCNFEKKMQSFFSLLLLFFPFTCSEVFRSVCNAKCKLSINLSLAVFLIATTKPF